MINIYFQLAGLVLTMMVAVLFASKTRLLFDTDMAFAHLMISILTVTVLNIIAVYGMELYVNGKLAEAITLWGGKIYMLFAVLVGYFSLRYTLIVVHNPNEELPDKTLYLKALVPLVLCALAAFFSDVSVKEKGSDGILYFSGSFVYISYLTLIVYLLLCAVVIFRHRSKMERHYFISATAFSVIIFGSIIITFFNPYYKILTFTMALAILFMYLEMENPDDYVDCVSGALNEYTFQKWGEKLLRDRNEMGFFVISLSNADDIKKKMEASEYEFLLRDMKQQLVKLHFGKVFRLDSGEFVCTAKPSEERVIVLGSIMEVVQNLSEKYSGFSAREVRYGAIPSLLEYDDISDFFQDLRFFLRHLETMSKDTWHALDEETLHIKREEDFIVLSLKQAILNDEIMVYYQPIYSTAKQKYTTAEALIRIRDLNGQFMSPERFIPIAEQQGYILTLGHAVFENVCRFIRENNLEEKGFDYIEINISTVQCMQKGLAGELVSMMKKYSISPGFINLEITETTAVKSENTLLKNMQRLIELGVSFSLDDYGSGYSNLDYVIRMPFYLVKLDKLLVWSSFEQEKTRVLLETSVEMFQQMHLKIVAEGVETKEQALYMAGLGVDYLQGYYFSKPVSEAEFLSLVYTNPRKTLA